MPRSARTIPLLVIALAFALAPPSGAQDGVALLRELSEQLAAGRYGEALTTARRCSEVLPGNAAIWYNLAGLEEHAGHRDPAVAALRQAVLVGFDDFRFADGDDDLGDLRADPAYAELRRAWANGLATRARSRRLELTAGQWSAPVALVDRRGGLDPPAAEARLRVTADHLDVEILAELRPVGNRPPWRGGTGLLMTVVLPEQAATGEGRLFVELGVGMADGIPAGAIRLGSHWQRIAELTPKLRRDNDGERLRVTFAVPWTVCDSLHPLVDPELGLNLTWIRGGGDAERGQAALIDDPAVGLADRPWRRGIPVRSVWTADAGPVAAGRIAERVVRDGTVELAPLAAVGGSAARLALRGRDGELAVQEDWNLTGEGAVRRRSGVLTPELPTGSARLGATVGEATWETNLVVLPEDWEAQTAARLAAAPERERPSLRYRLDAVVAALAKRHPRHDPAAIGATVDELERLLGAVATRGTSLPAGGAYLAVVPADAGDPDLLCSLAVPDGWRRGDPARTLLVLAHAPGQEQQAVLMAPRLLAERSAAGHATAPLIVAVAHLGAAHAADAARRDGLRLVDWLRDFVAVETVDLAGVDLLAATALELAAARPECIAGALLITGMDFVPYPELEPGQWPPSWTGLHPDLPVGWIWFPDEQRPGDQAAALQATLRNAGLDLEPTRTVAGGLDFSQAWSRAVVWASERKP